MGVDVDRPVALAIEGPKGRGLHSMRTGLNVGEQQSAGAHQRTIRVLSYCVWFEDFSKRTSVPVFDWENHQEDYLVRNKLSDVGLGYACDGHLNPDGQSVLADFLFENLAPMVRAKLECLSPSPSLTSVSHLPANAQRRTASPGPV